MKVSVIGLGYAGAVAAAGLAKADHDVLGIDIADDKIRAYRNGKVPFYEPGLSELIREGFESGGLRCLHADEVAEPLGEVIIVATGTPASDTGAADLRQVKAALSWALAKRSRGRVIVMKSTVPPGTGVRLCETALSGTTFRYVSNPEFLREGQAVHDWFHPDRIVIGGADPEAIESVKELFSDIDASYVITDTTSAEMIKYASNAFLGTKISFINEIAVLCDKIGATIDDVTRGVALDPRIGPSFLRAGLGYGGSCFPKDVRALDQLALTNDHNFELLRSVITVNNRQRLLPLYTLRERFGRLTGVKVAVLGLAFKPNTDDIREAPSLDLIRALVDDGAEVSAYDPRAIPAAANVLSRDVRLDEDLFACADGTQALVLVTEWPEIVGTDWEAVAGRMAPPRFVFDGRNALDAEVMPGYGFEYRGIGRGIGRQEEARAAVGAWTTDT